MLHTDKHNHEQITIGILSFRTYSLIISYWKTWNNWKITKQVITSCNEAKKTVVFKTRKSDSVPVFRRLITYSSLHNYFKNQLPDSLFILNFLFFKIFEDGCRSSNALWTKSFYQPIKVNACFMGSLFLPLNTRSPKELFYFCLQCV